jgi:hypothetical protein
MSTRDILDGLVKEGSFHRVVSPWANSDDEQPREIYVSRDVFDAIDGAMGDSDRDARLAEFRAWLEGFVENCELSVAEDPDRKPADTMLARVKPVNDEFWSIRVTDEGQSPGIRALGAFVDKDKFLALIWSYREQIENFDEEVDLVRDEWRRIFGSESPHKGAHLSDYLSNFIAV